MSLSIEIEIVYCFSRVFDLLFGRRSLRALGLTKVEVSIKKIKSKKTMSVIEDMLKFESYFISTLMPFSTHYDVDDLKILLFLL